MKPRFKLHDIMFFCLSGLIAASAAGVEMKRPGVDFWEHLRFVIEGMESKVFPENLFHFISRFFLTIFGYSDWDITGGKIPGREIIAAGMLSAVILEVIFAAAVCYWLYRTLPKNTPDRIRSFSLACTVLATGPFSIPMFRRVTGSTLIDCITTTRAINTWHNPTSYGARPFMVVSFFLFLHCMSLVSVPKNENKKRRIFGIEIDSHLHSMLCLAGSLFIMTYGKISTLQVLAPAALIMLIIWWAADKFSLARFKSCALIGLTFLPAIGYFIFNLFNYFPENSDGGIEFVGLARFFSTQIITISINHFIWLLLPIFVTSVRWKKIKRSKMFCFGWIVWAVSFLTIYMFKETGPRALDGNSTWGRYYATMILVLISLIELAGMLTEIPQVREIWRQGKGRFRALAALKDTKWRLCVLGYMLASVYLISGVVVIFTHMMQGDWFR